MECLICGSLIDQFAEATSRYFEAVVVLSHVVDSGPHHTREEHRRLFLQAKAQAEQQFENCERARDALRSHRSEYHRSGILEEPVRPLKRQRR